MLDESRQRLVRKGLRCRLFLDFIPVPVYGLLMDRRIRPKTTAVRKPYPGFRKKNFDVRRRRKKILYQKVLLKKILH